MSKTAIILLCFAALAVTGLVGRWLARATSVEEKADTLARPFLFMGDGHRTGDGSGG